MTNRPDADIEGATVAHARLLATIDALTDDDAARPSLLPGWTVGHVLTHLARNADSHVRILTAAAAGASVEQYQGGGPARDAAIEDGRRTAGVRTRRRRPHRLRSAEGTVGFAR